MSLQVHRRFLVDMLIIFPFRLCVDIGVCGVLLDELAARLYIVAHEHGEDFVGLGGILDGDLLQETGLRIHRCLPQLFGVHLTETFVALGVEGGGVLVAGNILVDEGLTLLFGVAVLRELLVRTLVERRRCDVEVPFLDDFRHEPIEERHDKGVDV